MVFPGLFPKAQAWGFSPGQGSVQLMVQVPGWFWWRFRGGSAVALVPDGSGAVLKRFRFRLERIGCRDRALTWFL